MTRRVIIVDDDRSTCELLAEELGEAGFDVSTEQSAERAVERVFSEEFDAVVTDLNMPGLGGLEFCTRVAANRPDLPVLVITGFGSMETAIEALRAGAFDFINKPFDVEAVALSLERAITLRSLREEVARLREAAAQAEGFGAMIGESRPMRRLYEVLHKVAPSPAAVLISGETGTGKELVARGLHAESPRAGGPFVGLNCAAMPAQLLESELFGHVKGAFTDARTANRGLFVQAHGGTLFLDEIGELPLELQPKLLRALQEKTLRPVGGVEDVPFDVRVMAATNRDLEGAVARGEFRQDLLYRINVVTVELPPLRARGNDILTLAQHFIDQLRESSGAAVTGLTSKAADKLLAYAWPGNVRELQNAVERAVTFAEHDKILVEDLPEKIRAYRSHQVIPEGHDPATLPPMEVVERRYVERVLEAVGGNKARAARILGFDRKTLYRKLERYGLGDGEGD